MIPVLCLMLADQMIKVKISSAYMQSVICCNWTSIQQRNVSERIMYLFAVINSEYRVPVEKGAFMMLDKIPGSEEMTTLVGQDLYDVWQQLCAAVDEKYDMECLWNKGGKAWTYEYKYRRGGKTLCALYARENCVGFMIIFGKDERAKVESVREKLSKEVQKIYDEAQTYHDGKWVMFEPVDASMFDDFMQLLAIKRKPNRK